MIISKVRHGTVALLFAGAVSHGVVFAEDTTIIACAHKNSGELRVVETIDDCRNSEVPLSWNQTGPPGDPGPPGPAGESANDDVMRLADLLGEPSLARGLPTDFTHPAECSATLLFEGPEGTSAVVTGLFGFDAVSGIFAYHVAVDGLIGSDAWIGQSGSVMFDRGGNSTTFGGMITELATSGDSHGNGFTVVTLEPYASALVQNSDYRVYQDRSVDGIIQETFAEAGLDYELALNGEYPTRDCTVQYNESDLDFVRRLTEKAGIFFFFDDAGAPTFGDANGVFAAGAPLLDYPGSAVPVPIGEEVVTALKRGAWLTPNQTLIRGYRLADPSSPFDGSAGAGDGSREKYSYEPSLTSLPAVEAQAIVNLERFRGPSDSVWGTSTAPDVRAGRSLGIQDGTSNGLGGDYVVTAVTHVFVRSNDDCLEYGNVFDAIPEALPYRPPLRTPVPTVNGLHSAIVTEVSGGGGVIDENGRVTVQFLWDRLGEFNENSFCPIRVVQPAGTLDGAAPFIPPAGEEVIVGFVQGDPSQPVVIGSLFNGQNQVPGS